MIHVFSADHLTNGVPILYQSKYQTIKIFKTPNLFGFDTIIVRL